MSREVCSLGTGELVIDWPTDANPQDVEDICEWLDLLTTKLRRRAAMGAIGDPPGDGSAPYALSPSSAPNEPEERS